MLNRLIRPRPATVAGRALFEAASAQARAPALYLRLGVPDTVEGRFESLLVHVVLVIHRLRGEGEQARETGQALFDAFIHNLDDGLREMGVGDLSVGKKMRKLGEAIYGRAKAYDPALDARPDTAPLTALVGRTVFGEADDARAEALAAYVAAVSDALAAQSLADLLAGRATFGEVAA